MINALILIKTEPGHDRDIVVSLLRWAAVKRAKSLTGGFDVYALVEAASLDDLRKFLNERVCKLAGLKKVDTYIEF